MGSEGGLKTRSLVDYEQQQQVGQSEGDGKQRENSVWPVRWVKSFVRWVEPRRCKSRRVKRIMDYLSQLGGGGEEWE
jgi:hypothetical protein